MKKKKTKTLVAFVPTDREGHDVRQDLARARSVCVDFNASRFIRDAIREKVEREVPREKS